MTTLFTRTLYLFLLFTPFALSFYFRYLLYFTTTLPVFVQATISVPLNTELYFSSPQSSLHFVSDSEVSLDYISYFTFTDYYLYIVPCVYR